MSGVTGIGWKWVGLVWDGVGWVGWAGVGGVDRNWLEIGWNCVTIRTYRPVFIYFNRVLILES